MSKSPVHSCPVCGRSSDDLELKVRGGVYRRCPYCGLLFLDPIPTADELTAFYACYRDVADPNGCGYLRPAGLAQYIGDKKVTLADLQWDFSRFRKAQLLDVGCANGAFLSFAEELGASAVGLDLSPELVEDAQQQGLSARLGGVETADGVFDIICLWDVLEHVPTPASFLDHVARLSKPGTALLIQTPRYGRIAELFGDQWRYLRPPQHIVLYSLDAVTRLLEQRGFRRVSWISFGSGNTTGTLSPTVKRAFDSLAKEMGHGDTMALWFERVRE